MGRRKKNKSDLYQFMEAHDMRRLWICFALVAMGSLTLIAGIVMLIIGFSTNQSLWIETENVKVSAGGFGAVTMFSSIVWGWLALEAVPKVQELDKLLTNRAYDIIEQELKNEKQFGKKIDKEKVLTNVLEKIP